jgi:PleD family two-component response regulator
MSDGRQESAVTVGRESDDVGQLAPTAHVARRARTAVAAMAPLAIGPDFDGARHPQTRRLREILIVDPDPMALFRAQNAVQSVANVETCSDFRVARARLLARPPDLLVTNLRLERFNGLHLVYLTRGTRTRSIVYSTQHDMGLAREARAAGASYERAERLPRALAWYVLTMPALTD